MKTKITIKDYLKVWFMALIATAFWAALFAGEYPVISLGDSWFWEWVMWAPVTIVFCAPFAALIGWNIYLLWLAFHLHKYTAKLESELDAKWPEPEIERKLSDYEQNQADYWIETRNPSSLPGQGGRITLKSGRYHQEEIAAIIRLAEINYTDTAYDLAEVEATLRPEPDNPHDADAVAVMIGDKRVAYLPTGVKVANDQGWIQLVQEYRSSGTAFRCVVIDDWDSFGGVCEPHEDRGANEDPRAPTARIE